MEEEQIGLERYLRFRVGQDAPLYRHALAIIDREMDPSSEFHGHLTLNVAREKYTLRSKETDLLRSLIARSLSVTSEQASKELAVEFVPFRGGEEQTITQSANHVILGRRGVGKSSLILLGVHNVQSLGDIPVWIDLEPYQGRRDPGCVVEVFREVFDIAAQRYMDSGAGSVADLLSAVVGAASPDNAKLSVETIGFPFS